jgi:HEAT repeat protein
MISDSLFGIAFPDRMLWFVALLIGVFFVSSLSLIFMVVLFRVRNVRRRKRWSRVELAWEHVMLDVLAGEKQADELNALVAARDNRYFVDFLLRYAARLKGAERDTVLQLARPYLPAIASQLERRSPERRARAVKTLGELDTVSYTSQIVAALHDPSPLVAITAAQALARHRSPDLVRDLVGSMETFELWDTRFLAAILAELGPDVAPALREFLADASHSVRTRALAAATLGELNDPAAADCAAEVLETEKDVDLLVAALRLIRNVGSGAHVAAVRSLLESPSPAVRGYAVSALVAIGTPDDTAIIEAAIDDESSWVVMHAARGLEALGRLDILRLLAASDHPRASAAREILAGTTA